MPRRDKTGPLGRGPRTGRGLGLCVGSRALRCVAGIGAGLGLGLACRHGLGRRIRSVELENDETKSERQILEEKKVLLQKILKQILR